MVGTSNLASWNCTWLYHCANAKNQILSPLVHLGPWCSFAVGRLALLFRRTNPMFCFIKNPPWNPCLCCINPLTFSRSSCFVPSRGCQFLMLTSQLLMVDWSIQVIAMIHRSQPFLITIHYFSWTRSDFFDGWPHAWRVTSNSWRLTTLTLLGPIFLHG